jgi:sucrose-6-phosphate hydrolase SacC (GH32 family)
MHWGLMVSDDLVHWENLQDAFYPALNKNGMSGLGSKGIWSGDVVVDGDTAYAFYTTVNFDGKFDPGVAWAKSTESNLENWEKKGGVIDKNQPNPGAIGDFRDPYVWQQDNRWHMIIGAAIGSGGALEHYTSSNLATGNWTRSPQPFSSLPFASMDIGSAIWEMPVFEYLGKYNGQDKYILVVSPIGGAMRKTEAPYVRSVYWIGTWNSIAANGAGQFIPDYAQPKNLDVIHGHLSPTIARAANGELTAIGIVDERTNSQIQNDLGWAHTYSLPRVWQLLADGKTLGQQPSAALQSLRDLSGQKTFSNIGVNGEHKLTIASNQVEIIAEVNPAQTASSYGLVISASPDRDEYTRIYYDGDDLVIDKSNSSNLTGLEESGIYRGSYDEAAFGKPTKFHVFIDHSAIAVFINDKAVFENRIYPVRQDSQEIALYSAGGSTTFTQIVAYPLRAADGVKRPKLNISSSSAINEGAESGQQLTIDLTDAMWAGSLSITGWNLIGAPVGVSIDSLERVSVTQVKLTLAGNAQSDYDLDIVNAQLQVAANQLADDQSTITGTLPRFTAVIEPVTTITQSAPEEIAEGQEAGKSILIQLVNNQFKSPLNMTDWSVKNLPAGLTYDLALVNAQTARITLLGSAQDYDLDVVNFGVTIQPAAFVNVDPELNGAAVSVDTGIKFTAKSGVIAFNFESADLAGWCSSGGDAFTVLGVSNETNWWNGLFNQEGLFHFWGFNSGEDVAVGQMRTGDFVLEGDGKINYRIAGGNDLSNLYLALVRTSTNEILLKDTGNNSETYVERTFDASAFIGETLYLRAHDSATGGWGHINLDDIKIPVADQLDGMIPVPCSTSGGQSSSSVLASSSTSSQVSSSRSSSAMTSSSRSSSSVSTSSSNAVQTSSLASSQASGLLVYDFEAGNLDGWTIEGSAFSIAAISSDTQFWDGIPFNQQGVRHLWSFKAGGDQPQGRMTTNAFTLGGDGIIRLKVSGGNDINNLYVAVVHAGTNNILARVTGSDTEAYAEVSMNMSAYLGENLQVQLVDTSSGGFGHINIDDLRIPTGPAVSYKILDFETGTLAGWTAQGAAFTAADVTSDSCYWAECFSFKRQGNFHLWGFKAGGDIDQGELRSETFTLGGNGQIRALISGGNDLQNLYLALIDDQNGAELMRITGNNAEEFVEKTMDASAFTGRRCYLKVVDQATGGWGHLNLDYIRIPQVN